MYLFNDGAPAKSQAWVRNPKDDIHEQCFPGIFDCLFPDFSEKEYKKTYIVPTMKVTGTK